MNLCHYIGRPLTAQIDISDDFPEVEQEWKVQVSDITARPEYGILNKQIAIAEQEVKLNRSELLPRIGVRGSYDYLHGLEVNDETLMKKASLRIINYGGDLVMIRILTLVVFLIPIINVY
jgi:outer membrane protein TolC